MAATIRAATRQRYQAVTRGSMMARGPAAPVAGVEMKGKGRQHVRFSTDDGQFGLVVSPRPSRGMFAFQLVIDSQVIGDDEPAILGSVMQELQHRPTFDTQQLPDARTNPASVVELLLADKRYESAMLRGAESLDRWLVWLYIQQAHAFALAQAAKGNHRTGPILVSVIDPTDLRPLLDAVIRYWTEANASSQR